MSFGREIFLLDGYRRQFLYFVNVYLVFNLFIKFIGYSDSKLLSSRVQISRERYVMGNSEIQPGLPSVP